MKHCQPYPEYKPSGVDWLGDVPKHWKVKPFFTVAHETKTKNVGMRENNLLSLSYGKIVQKDINTDFGLLPESFETYQIVDRGFIILRLTDLQNDHTSLRVGMAAEKGIITSAYVSIKTTSTFLSNFLFYFLYNLDIQKIFYNYGGGVRQSMRFDDLKWLQILLPEPAEQQAIADYLDRKTGKVDTLIEKKKQLIARLKEKRTALISCAVTKGLDPSVKLKPSGVEWLGDVPEHWSALPLRRVIKAVRTGSTPAGVDDSAFEDEGFNWFAPGDFSEALFLTKANRTLSQEGRQEVRVFPKNTVMLVGIGATIGKVALSRDDSSCNQQINGIICGELLHPLFVTYYLKTMKHFIVKCGKYTTLPIINQDETKNLVLTCPPLSEQKAIADYLDRETGKIDALIEKVEDAVEKLREYRIAFISAAVTGKIDVRKAAA